MGKKGFTLVEILGVIIILASMALLTSQIIVDKVKKINLEAEESSKKIILSSAKDYIELMPPQYVENTSLSYCISYNQLINFGTLNDEMIPKIDRVSYLKDYFVEISYDGFNYTYNVVESCEANSYTVTYSYLESNQTFTATETGIYTIKAYGARGSGSGGYGGYVEATVSLNINDVVTINTGGMNGYNGGGAKGSPSGYNGGGATTIKLNNNIIIAAAGGGGGISGTPGGVNNGLGGAYATGDLLTETGTKGGDGVNASGGGTGNVYSNCTQYNSEYSSCTTGENTCEPGYKTCTDATICGYKTCTIASVCGYKTCTNADVCGYKTCTIVSVCGYKKCQHTDCGYSYPVDGTGVWCQECHYTKNNTTQWYTYAPGTCDGNAIYNWVYCPYFPDSSWHGSDPGHMTYSDLSFNRQYGDGFWRVKKVLNSCNTAGCGVETCTKAGCGVETCTKAGCGVETCTKEGCGAETCTKEGCGIDSCLTGNNTCEPGYVNTTCKVNTGDIYNSGNGGTNIATNVTVVTNTSGVNNDNGYVTIIFEA